MFRLPECDTWKSLLRTRNTTVPNAKKYRHKTVLTRISTFPYRRCFFRRAEKQIYQLPIDWIFLWSFWRKLRFLASNLVRRIGYCPWRQSLGYPAVRGVLRTMMKITYGSLFAMTSFDYPYTERCLQRNVATSSAILDYFLDACAALVFIITNTQAITDESHVHPWLHCAKIMSAPPASWLVHCATQPQPGHLCKDLAVFSMAGKRHSWIEQEKQTPVLQCLKFPTVHFQPIMARKSWGFSNSLVGNCKQGCPSRPWLHLSKSAPLARPTGRPGVSQSFFFDPKMLVLCHG